MVSFQQSQRLYERSSRLAPAGVHSPVRAFRAVGGHPIFFEKGLGTKLWDVDGNEYVDFCNSWGRWPSGMLTPILWRLCVLRWSRAHTLVRRRP